MKDLINCAVREMKRRKMRAVVHVAAFFISTLFVVLSVNMLYTSRADKARILNNVGTHIVAFHPVPSEEFNSIASSPKAPIDWLNEAFYASPMVITRLFFVSETSSFREIPGVSDASPILLFRFKQPDSGMLFSVAGFDTANKTVVPFGIGSENDLVSGAFIKNGDKGVAVLDERFATVHGMKIGSNIVVAGVSFPVIGIIRPGIRPVPADVLLGFEDAKSVIDKRISQPLDNEANIMLVEITSSSVQDDTIARIKKKFPGIIVNTFHCFVGAASVMGINENMLWLLALTVWIAALVFSVNSQWTSVVERRKEIGILRALGWTRREIAGQIVLEAVLQALTGASAGAVAALLIHWKLPEIPWITGAPSLNISAGSIVMFAGIALTVAGAALGGLFPAFAAANDNPASVIRSI